MFESIRKSTGTTAIPKQDSRYKVVDGRGTAVGYSDTRDKADALVYALYMVSEGKYRVKTIAEQSKPKTKTVKKSSTTKRTAKKKSTAKRPSKRADKPSKQGKMYASTPKKKTAKSTYDDYLTITDLKNGYASFKDGYAKRKSAKKEKQEKPKKKGHFLDDIVASLIMSI